MFTITLGHLLERGVSFQRYEALAIAQELIAGGEGVPTVDNVQLSSDGSATCMSTRGTPQVSDVAALLQALLPKTAGQVPAPLRYTLGRGLGAVEAPPFESLEAFSQSLARFEAGDRHGIIRSLLQRVADVPPVAPRRVAVSTHAVPAIVAPPIAPSQPARPAVITMAVPAVVAPTTRPAPSTAALPVVVAPSTRPAQPAHPAGSSTPVPAVVAPPIRPAQPARPAITAAHAASPAPVMGATAAPPRELFVSSAPPSQARPINWRTAVVAIAASFVIGALGGQWAGLWQPAAATDARPPAAERSAVRPPAESGVPKPRAAERPVSTTGSAPMVPHTDVAVTPALETQPPSPHEDLPIGTPVPMISRDSEAAFSPAFVNTGSAMFFHTGGAGDRSSAIAMTPDAASAPVGDLRIIKVLDDGARNYHPRPSPDGRLIAFDSDRDGERGVYVANGNGTEVRRVSGEGYAAAPTWSPDGKRLAYIRAETANPRVWNLWVQPLGGERSTRVTSHQFGQTWSASWFPDNKRICYTHEDKIIVRDLETGASRQFTSPVAGRIVRTPAVSPDGTKVVFQVFRNGGWMLDLADGSMRHVLSDPTAEEFAWAPDGNRIAFHSRRTGEWSIYVVAPG